MPKTPRRLHTAAAALRRADFSVVDMGHATANVAVFVSVTLVCLALILQAPFHALDPQRCGALVRRGAWPPYSRPPEDLSTEYEPLRQQEDDNLGPPLARSFAKWEPAGCRMLEYSRDNIRDCLGGQRMLFVGDATARVLFFAAMTRLDHEEAEWLIRETFSDADPRHDLTADVETVQLHFVWDPWLNSSMLRQEIYRMRDPSPEAPALSSPLPPKPELTIVASNGLWAARNAGEAYFDIFRNATDLVASAMQDRVRPWSTSDDSKLSLGNSLFFVPVPVPLYDALQPGRAKTLTPERIERMNHYLDSLPSSVRSHILTAYIDMMYDEPEAYEDTGLHVTGAVAERWIDIPLNARCNGQLVEDGGSAPKLLAYKTTCCLPYPRTAWVQSILWYSLCVVVGVAVGFAVFGSRTLPAVYPALAILCATRLYCYAADRSHLFAKSEKHYNGGQLLFSSALAAIVFLVFRKRIPDPNTTPVASSKDDNDVSELALDKCPPLAVDFLPRHVSDEWKGLMQAALLLLAYQDVADSPVFVQWTGFFANAYLFLSAFGHTSYFLRSDDFSLRRVVIVLARINTLPLLLNFLSDEWASSTPHSVSRLYRFPRLVSFWFLVTVATLWPVRYTPGNKTPTLVLLRVGISAAVLLVTIQRVCQLAPYLGAQLNADSIWRALAMNWLAPYLGMAVAVLARRTAQLRNQIETSQRMHKMREGSLLSSAGNNRVRSADGLDRLLMASLHTPRTAVPVKRALSVCCFVCLVVYARTAQTERPINDHGVDIPSHPYLASAAVVSVAILRNCHLKLRTVYLACPAALGVFALELSILNSHIFLSGNGTGHLRLFPEYTSPRERSGLGAHMAFLLGRVLRCYEIGSLAVVLLAVSWLVHQATIVTVASLFGEPGRDQAMTGGLLALDRETREDSAREERHGLPSDDWRAASLVRGRGKLGSRKAKFFYLGVLICVWIANLVYG